MVKCDAILLGRAPAGRGDGQAGRQEGDVKHSVHCGCSDNQIVPSGWWQILSCAAPRPRFRPPTITPFSHIQYRISHFRTLFLACLCKCSSWNLLLELYFLVNLRKIVAAMSLYVALIATLFSAASSKTFPPLAPRPPRRAKTLFTASKIPDDSR